MRRKEKIVNLKLKERWRKTDKEGVNKIYRSLNSLINKIVFKHRIFTN